MKPVTITVQGQVGSGKSHVIKAIERLFKAMEIDCEVNLDRNTLTYKPTNETLVKIHKLTLG